MAVVIIGVLIAVLLPSLGRAWEGAKLLQCVTNLRQAGPLFAGECDNHSPGGGHTRPSATDTVGKRAFPKFPMVQVVTSRREAPFTW